MVDKTLDDDELMPLYEHLQDLRRKFFSVVLVFAALFGVAFYFAADFYRILVRGLETELVVLSPTGVLHLYLLLACNTAAVGTMPFALFQLWRFLRPALTAKERRVVAVSLPVLFLLFLSGIVFAYSIVFPLIFQFLLALAGPSFQILLTTGAYFRFLLRLLVPFGVLFELPLLLFVLTKLNLVQADRLQKKRKEAYFLLLLIAVVLTPPDLVTDILVVVPLILLYEISLCVAKFARVDHSWQKNEMEKEGEIDERRKASATL